MGAHGALKEHLRGGQEGAEATLLGPAACDVGLLPEWASTSPFFLFGTSLSWNLGGFLLCAPPLLEDIPSNVCLCLSNTRGASLFKRS